MPFPCCNMYYEHYYRLHCECVRSRVVKALALVSELNSLTNIFFKKKKKSNDEQPQFLLLAKEIPSAWESSSDIDNHCCV